MVRRLLVVLLGVVLLAGVAVAGTAWWLERRVEREDVFSGLEEDDRPEAVPTEALTLLVLGSDDREDEVGAQFAGPPGDFHETGERADTTLLVRLTEDRDAAWVVSIPRDSWVDLPACTGRDGEPLPAREGQFALAFRDGGLSCTVMAVEALTQVRVDHTVVVDFSGFTEVVEALGGVPVCLDEPFEPEMVDVRLPAGRHVLGPDQALAFVRARYGVDDGGDLARIERQKRFMAAMVERARSRGVVLRPDRVVRFASAVAGSLRVDQDLDVRGLALSVREIDPARVVFTTVPLDPDPGPQYAEGGRLYGRVKWDDAAAAALFTELKADRVPAAPSPPGPSAPASGAPSTSASAAPAPTATPSTRSAADDVCG